MLTNTTVMFLMDRMEYRNLVIAGWTYHILMLVYLKRHTKELENLGKEQYFIIYKNKVIYTVLTYRMKVIRQ